MCVNIVLGMRGTTQTTSNSYIGLYHNPLFVIEHHYLFQQLGLFCSLIYNMSRPMHNKQIKETHNKKQLHAETDCAMQINIENT